jgi:hypothetical protein
MMNRKWAKKKKRHSVIESTENFPKTRNLDLFKEVMSVGMKEEYGAHCQQPSKEQESWVCYFKPQGLCICSSSTVLQTALRAQCFSLIFSRVLLLKFSSLLPPPPQAFLWVSLKHLVYLSPHKLPKEKEPIDYPTHLCVLSQVL